VTELATISSLTRLRARFHRPSRTTAIDVGAISVAWVVGAIRILRYGLGFDNVTYATPAQQVTLQAWRQLRLPLWSNTTFGGTPHLGNVQTAAMYPGHLLSAPFPDLMGPNVEMAFHLLLFGLGFYLLGRRLGFARPAPVVMAVAAMWSGATLLRAPLLIHFPPLAWVPLAAVCLHAAVTAAHPRRALAALAVTVWAILISGHPQSILMAFTLLGAWAVGLIIEHRAWRRIGHLAGVGALSLAMAAPVLLALRHSMAAAADSSRDEAVLLNPSYIVQLRTFPRLILGEPLSGLHTLYEQNERLTYAGVAIFAFGLVGAVAVSLARRWSIVAVALVGMFAATLSLGPRSPTMRFARAFLPGFDQPRVSARWNWVLVMALILLAGAGIDRLRRGIFRPGGAVVAVAGALVAAGILVGVEDAGARNSALWIVMAGLVVTVAVVAQQRTRTTAAWLLAALAVFELGMPIARMIEDGSAEITDTSQLIGPTERWLADQSGLTQQLINGDSEGQYLVAGLRPNANTLAGVRLLDGYDGGVAISRRWHAALLQINESYTDLLFGAQLPAALDPGSFARLGVRFVLYDPARGPATESLPGWEQRDTTGYFRVFENPLWQGDVTAWYTAEVVANPEAAGNTLREHRGQYDNIGLVESRRAALTCTGTCAPTYSKSTSTQSGERDALVQLTHPAVVAFNEQFDEGWTVTIDGSEATVIPVDGIWAGVAVPAGEHRLELRYAPSWVAPSLVLMMLAWLGVAALCFGSGLWPFARRRCADTL